MRETGVVRVATIVALVVTCVGILPIGGNVHAQATYTSVWQPARMNDPFIVALGVRQTIHLPYIIGESDKVPVDGGFRVQLTSANLAFGLLLAPVTPLHPDYGDYGNSYGMRVPTEGQWRRLMTLASQELGYSSVDEMVANAGVHLGETYGLQTAVKALSTGVDLINDAPLSVGNLITSLWMFAAGDAEHRDEALRQLTQRCDGARGDEFSASHVEGVVIYSCIAARHYFGMDTVDVHKKFHEAIVRSDWLPQALAEMESVPSGEFMPLHRIGYYSR